MAVRGYFYNATDANDTERRYNGEDMNQDKAPFYKEGVVFGHLQVKAAGGSMSVEVDGGEKTGYAYINMHTIHNTSTLKLTLNQASGTLPRIDRIVIQNSEIERKPQIYVKQGAYSNTPKPPELTNDNVIQEKSLAQIFVDVGAVEITQADIKDERADESVCGYIASQFNDVDFGQFSAQFESWSEKKRTEFIDWYNTNTEKWKADFNEWFKDVEETLSGDVAGNLLTKINMIQDKLSITKGTLKAGETEITIEDNKITDNSILTFYTSIYGVNPNMVEVSIGKVTVTFDAQDQDMEVGVSVNG